MTHINPSKQPSTKDLQRSQALQSHLHQIIQASQGGISFAEFSQQALYHPDYGYYARHPHIFGAEGDFVTAPEISKLFGQCLSAFCSETFNCLEAKQILEFGAGSGKLAADILLALERQDDLPLHYFILEPSPGLIKKQQDYLNEHCPHLLNRIHWLSEIPKDFVGIIVANEVLDALPANRFIVENGQAKELGVSINEQGFHWQTLKTGNPDLIEEANSLMQAYDLTEGYQSEIHLSFTPFINRIAQNLKQGVVIFADYGYGEAEFYHPERRKGTLTCFYQHQHFDDPFIHPGLVDISCHVNFTKVIELASTQDFDLIGFTTQAGFLMDCGLTQLASKAEANMNKVDLFQLHQAIKTLILPTEMGDRIKFMGLAKHCEPPTRGFANPDRRRDL